MSADKSGTGADTSTVGADTSDVGADTPGIDAETEPAAVAERSDVTDVGALMVCYFRKSARAAPKMSSRRLLPDLALP